MFSQEHPDLPGQDPREARRPVSRGRGTRSLLQRVALATGLALTWSVVSPGVAACAAEIQRATTRPTGHTRHLSPVEMRHIFGGQISSGSGQLATMVLAADGEGASQPWQGSVSGTSGGTINPSSMNKLTAQPIVAWSGRGPTISLSLYHNSVGTTNNLVGNKWSHSYNVYLVAGSDPENPTEQVVEGNGQGNTYTPNVDGSYSAPAGIYDTLVHNSDGTWTLTRKNQTKWKFNSTGWLISITDRNSNAVTLSYDSTNHLTSVTDATGSRSLTFTWNSGETLITAITDPLSRTWTLSHDSSNNLTSVTEPALSGTSYGTSFGYDSSSHITSKTDRRGKVWTYSYSGDGLAWEKDPLNNETTYATSTGSSTSTTTVTDPNSHSTVYTTNLSTGNLSSVEDAASDTESYGYDSNHDRTSVTDKRGYVWSYTFDSRGNVLTATDPLSNETVYTFNSTNDLLTVTSPLGHETSYVYDTNGNCTSATDALSHVTSYTYNSYGLVTQITDALSHGKTIGYDTNGDPTTVTDALSHTTTTAYDTLGRPTSVTTASGLTTTTAYDAWERVSSVTMPGTRTTAYAYDAESNRTGVTNALSQTDSFAYDDAGRLISHTDALSHSVSYSYDAAGNRTGFTDGNSHTTSYSFTARNELSGITYPDSTSQSYTYLATGQLHTATDGRSVVKTESYDNDGRFTGISYSDGTTPSVSFSYDADSRKTSMVDGTGTTSYGYDNADRLTSRSAPEGTVTFGYDDANRLTGRTVTAGTSTLSYDNADRLTSVAAPGASGSETTSYTFDSDNRLSATTFANGSVETRSYSSTTGDLSSISRAASSTGSAVSSYTYAYDALARKTSETRIDGTVVSYGYDAAGRLTNESLSGTSGYTLACAYDNAGNRTSKTLGSTTTESYTYDSANKLLTAGVKSYTYDNAGNTTSVANSTTGVTTTLTWDGGERVTAASSTAGLSNSYVYNGLDQRTGKTDSTGTFSYVREGDGVDAAVLSDGAASYTHGLGLVSEVRGSGTSAVSKYYHADALGSTRELTDASASVTDTHATDAFGNLVASSGSTPTPFGFVGQSGYQGDADTGLMLLGYRYYDSSTGRFLSRDPILDDDNWYVYADNDPINTVDPGGLAPNQQTINSLERRINNVTQRIAKREGELREDPQNLPEHHPNEKQNPSLSRSGHRQLINEDKKLLDKLKKELRDEQFKGYEGGGIQDMTGEIVWYIIQVTTPLKVVKYICPISCFDGNTPVLMSDGKTKAIKDIRAGDLILSRNRAGEIVSKSVLGTSVTEATELISLTFSNGDEINVTPHHQIYVDGKGFIEAREVTRGFTCSSPSGKTSLKTRAIHPTNKSLQVYNLLVGDTHTYFVGRQGELVHDLSTGVIPQVTK